MRQKWQKTGSGCREGSRSYNQQTYPKLLHFFFLEVGHHEQRSMEGRGGWVKRREKEKKLRKRKTTNTTKEVISPKDPCEKEENKW